MQIQITRMENDIVTCEILDGDGGRIDIVGRWFAKDAVVRDQMVFKRFFLFIPFSGTLFDLYIL